MFIATTIRRDLVFWCCGNKCFKIVGDTDKLAWDNLVAHISVVATHGLQDSSWRWMMNSVGTLDLPKKGFVYSLSLYNYNGKLIMHFGVFITCVSSTPLVRNALGSILSCNVLHSTSPLVLFHIYLRFSWASGATPSRTYCCCGLPFGVTHNVLPILGHLDP